ncbi:Non-LTR (Long terminal repeat) retrotransposon and domain-containing protein [Elysia marginata]|uniref:Non-LTR (Long terminal repeat) retrotransposon and domain-containing protein n=1 Tax=Elysia marginata TaxID=1093978 RepID=A0AAV4GLP3_9GAST|nr:Non-LTR (Long terminal repeat) retrotransposon and domain-containing protein [Elysia marginata]
MSYATDKRDERREFLLKMFDDENMGNKVELSEWDVRKALRRLNPNKAQGPDGVSPSVLKYCADQLGDILAQPFNLSLLLCTASVENILYCSGT